MKQLFQKTPLWFLLIWIVGFMMIVFNSFQSNSGTINLLALFIINVANAIRIWKNERSLAITFLVVATLCLAYILVYFYRYV
ncbi:di/tricarboxylate transporter [Paenibacillus sp. W4I10]|nr:di/tricarboxylate transporter [Paenibacillus sp. W4I10]MDR6718265.1 di/tricarboxylate transporter [Paenibacillus sp. 2003]